MKRTLTEILPNHAADGITPDTPLRLSVAAKLAFPDGSMTASGLRREAARGRLVIECIANRHYTTIAAIERMRDLCRVEVRGPASGFNQPAGIGSDKFWNTPSGSSATAQSSGALALARAKLSKLKRRSPTTSSQNPKRRGRATGTPPSKTWCTHVSKTFIFCHQPHFNE
jgi:hypothetical protein